MEVNKTNENKGTPDLPLSMHSMIQIYVTISEIKHSLGEITHCLTNRNSKDDNNCMSVHQSTIKLS